MSKRLYHAIDKRDIPAYVQAVAKEVSSPFGTSISIIPTSGLRPYRTTLELLTPNSRIDFNVGREASGSGRDVGIGFIDSPLYLDATKDSGIDFAGSSCSLYVEADVDARGAAYLTVIAFDAALGDYQGSVMFEAYYPHDQSIRQDLAFKIGNHLDNEVRYDTTFAGDYSQTDVWGSMEFGAQGETRDKVSTSLPDEENNITVALPFFKDYLPPENVVFLTGQATPNMVSGDTVELDLGDGPQTYMYLSGFSGNLPPSAQTDYLNYVNIGILLKFN